MTTQGTITPADATWPTTLSALENPPVKLHYRGDLSLLAGDPIALTGNVHSTSTGEHTTMYIAQDLASAGEQIITGPRPGIETMAIRASLRAGGRPILVIGATPHISDRFLDEVAAKGLILSPVLADSTAPTNGEIDSVISALTRLVVVFEAEPDGPVVRAAVAAAEDGATVCVFPGQALVAAYAGSNTLIQHGAHMVVDADQITALR